jgi:hypothetical protein
MPQLPVEKTAKLITFILSVKFCVYEVLYSRTEMYMYVYCRICLRKHVYFLNNNLGQPAAK